MSGRMGAEFGQCDGNAYSVLHSDLGAGAMTDTVFRMTDTLIRPASLHDLAAVIALLADDELGAGRELSSSALDLRYEKAFADMGAQEGNELLVMVDGDTVIACLQLTVIPGLSRLGAKRAQIEGVRVARAYRQRGAGNRLMRFAIARARDAGCTLVQLTTDKARGDALRFYRKLGFEASHIGMKLAL